MTAGGTPEKEILLSSGKGGARKTAESDTSSQQAKESFTGWPWTARHDYEQLRTPSGSTIGLGRSGLHGSMVSRDPSWADDYSDQGEKTEPGTSGTPGFAKAVMLVLLVNFVAIAVEASLISDREARAVFEVLEFIFAALYGLELVIRVRDLQLGLFCSGHNWPFNLLDASLVVAAVADAGAVVVGAATAKRIFRALRVLRLLRILRFLQADRILRFVLEASLKLALLLTLTVFGAAAATTFLLWDVDANPGHLSDNFKDLGTSMWSILKIMTSEDGADTIDTVYSVEPWMIPPFAAFLFVTTIALTAVSPAVFIETQLLRRDKRFKRMAQEHRDELRQKESQVRDLTSFLKVELSNVQAAVMGTTDTLRDSQAGQQEVAHAVQAELVGIREAMLGKQAAGETELGVLRMMLSEAEAQKQAEAQEATRLREEVAQARQELARAHQQMVEAQAAAQAAKADAQAARQIAEGLRLALETTSSNKEKPLQQAAAKDLALEQEQTEPVKTDENKAEDAPSTVDEGDAVATAREENTTPALDGDANEVPQEANDVAEEQTTPRSLSTSVPGEIDAGEDTKE